MIKISIVDRNDGDVLRGSDWQSVIDTVENTTSGHDHDGADSKSLDWDDCWSDAVHSHASAAEGGDTLNPTEALFQPQASGTDTEGEMHYNSTDDCFKYRDDADSKRLPAIMVEEMTEDTTEYSQAGTGSLVSYTFTPESANNVLLQIQVKADLKVSADTTSIYIQITNNTTSEVCDLGLRARNAAPYCSLMGANNSSYVTDIKAAVPIPSHVADETLSGVVSLNDDFMVNGATYTVDFICFGSTGTTYVDNLTLTMIYAINTNKTTSSGRWS